MPYIPTIHTFEDDVNENRKTGEIPISGGLESIISEKEILVPEVNSKSSTKILLISISVFFILASVAAVVYYLYKQQQELTNQNSANQQILKNQEMTEQQAGLVEDLKSILPNLSANTKIASLIESASLLNNVIIIKISKDQNQEQNSESNYPVFFATILANQKDLYQDLISAFKLSSPEEKPPEENSDDSTSALKLKEVNDIIWVSKTINNQDYKITDSGVSAFVSGYLGTDYFILTTNLKDFLATIKDLQKQN